MAYMAIETKYLGPTDYRGSRIKATARDTFSSDEKPKSVTVSMDYALDTDANHERAALALLPKVCNNPDGVQLHKGATQRGYVFVVVPVMEEHKAETAEEAAQWAEENLGPILIPDIAPKMAQALIDTIAKARAKQTRLRQM